MTVTLADIERAAAPRCGPYRLLTVTSGVVGSFVCDAIRSSVERGDDITDLWVLRRGLLADGSAVPSYDPDDRVRLAKDYVASTGTITVDRDYATAPVATEHIELHHLHPTDELRAAVLSGLKRCYMVDRASVTLTATAAERDLTAEAPWITDPQQVYAVASLPAGSVELPYPQWWDRTFTKDGAVWLALSPDPYPQELLVTSKRPHWSFVNGVTSDTGPTADDDELAVDLHYAASAAHIEAWRIAQDKLQSASAEAYRLSMPLTALTFSAAARQHFIPPQRQWRFDEPNAGAMSGMSRGSLW